MKVGYILRKFPILSETFILNEILELEKQGVDIHIFSVDRPNDPRFHSRLADLKAHVTYVPDILKWKSLLRHQKKAKRMFKKGYREARKNTLKQMNPSLYLRLMQSCYVANHAHKMGIEHLHAHFATRATTVAYLSAQILDCPYTFTAHAVDIFKESLCQKALQTKMDNAKWVITVSEYNLRYLNNKGTANNILKVHNGIDLDFFVPSLRSPDTLFTFLIVARFVEKKGHRVLVNACRILKEQGVQFQCLLVGKGKLQSKIEAQIKANYLEDVVKILGPLTQNEVLERYHQSHALVLPCTTGSDGNKDGLPVSIVEALACGLPVITTSMTGNPEVVEEGMNGFLIPYDDAKATAEAMRTLVENKTQYKKLKENTRSSILESFDQRQTVKDLAKVFIS